MKHSQEEQAKRLSQELDRYLLVSPSQPPSLSTEDEPDLALGIQLTQVDLSYQSKIHHTLRSYLSTERGIQSTTPSTNLIKAANKRQHATLDQLTYISALLLFMILINIWSWTSSTSSMQAEEISLQPSPALIIPIILEASQVPLEADPQPIPTPLAPNITGIKLTKATFPLYQYTPPSTPSLNTDPANP